MVLDHQAYCLGVGRTEPQSTHDVERHLRAHGVVAKKASASILINGLGARFGYIVQQATQFQQGATAQIVASILGKVFLSFVSPRDKGRRVFLRHALGTFHCL